MKICETNNVFPISFLPQSKLKLKMFTVLLSIDIVVSVMSFLTEKTFSFDGTAPNNYNLK